MPFDERKAVEAALLRAGEEFSTIIEYLARQFPDVMVKGAMMIGEALPTADSDRAMRQQLQQITDPDQWMQSYQEFVQKYGEQRAQEMLAPRRYERVTPPADPFGGDGATPGGY